jgi:phosphomannomutase
MIHNLVSEYLVLGIDVIDLGLSTTPTVEVAVPLRKQTGELFLPPHTNRNGMP